MAILTPTFSFLMILILGTTISISSSTWFGAWIGLELNLMSFIPLLAMKMNSLFSEASLKYFLIQALGSTIIIMSSSLFFLFLNLPLFFVLTALLLKLGAAPFYFWFPEVMSGLSWFQVIILMTIQKVAPMILISYISTYSFIIKPLILSSILSALVGAFGGLNNLNLRKILAFSSINHMSWMLISICISDNMWLIYFCFYSLISSSVVMLFIFYQIHSLSDLLTFKTHSIFSSLSIPLVLLSLGGLPPFTGFLPKWLIIQIMMNSSMYVPLFFLLFSALITLYFYLRLLTPFIVLLNSSTMILSKLGSSPVNFFPLLIISLNFIGFLVPMPFIFL
uniref:NADH-ubiquinone oxidoreductase chain 2 n=1 Tax=Maja crispata TaxID=471962 RepID=A0A343E793_9EUCA|nr:NADH dehydrogenase subunit 2 [Maja crispata]ASF62441.1 NADH dehydrogenase subunit 2 [Maja crispata]